MTKMHVVRLDVVSTAKFAGIVGACCGPLVFLVLTATELYRGTFHMSAVQIPIYIAALVLPAGVLAFWGIVLGAVVAAVFNLIARWTGGIVVEVQ